MPPPLGSLGQGYDMIASNTFERQPNSDATSVCVDKQDFLIESLISDCVTNIHNPGQAGLLRARGNHQEENTEQPQAVNGPLLTQTTDAPHALSGNGNKTSSTFVSMTNNDARCADSTFNVCTEGRTCDAEYNSSLVPSRLPDTQAPQPPPPSSSPLKQRLDVSGETSNYQTMVENDVINDKHKAPLKACVVSCKEQDIKNVVCV